MQPVSSPRRPSTRPAPAPRPGIRPQPLRLLWWLSVILALVSAPVAWAEPSAAPASPAALDVRISQVYGAGGTSGAPYQNDFIELFNAGSTEVSITGWSVQYAGVNQPNWQVTSLSGSILPGGYYLVKEGKTNSCADGKEPCGSPLPADEVTGNINLGSSAGKVALVNTTAQLAGSCPPLNTIVDLVGYSANADCYEGNNPAPAASAAAAIARGGEGCTDTDDNGADFSTAAPAPRNASTSEKSCGLLAVEVSSFSAETVGNHVALAWETVSEIHNAGFNVYRSAAQAGPFNRANDALIPAAAPGSNSGHVYQWTDAAGSTGAASWYLLEAVDLDGSVARHGPVAATPSTPNAIELSAASARSQPGTALAIGVAVVLAAGWGVAAQARRRRGRGVR